MCESSLLAGMTRLFACVGLQMTDGGAGQHGGKLDISHHPSCDWKRTLHPYCAGTTLATTKKGPTPYSSVSCSSPAQCPLFFQEFPWWLLLLLIGFVGVRQIVLQCCCQLLPQFCVGGFEKISRSSVRTSRGPAQDWRTDTQKKVRTLRVRVPYKAATAITAEEAAVGPY
jgi:hypothetical protein